MHLAVEAALPRGNVSEKSLEGAFGEVMTALHNSKSKQRRGTVSLQVSIESSKANYHEKVKFVCASAGLLAPPVFPW